MGSQRSMGQVHTQTNYFFLWVCVNFSVFLIPLLALILIVLVFLILIVLVFNCSTLDSSIPFRVFYSSTLALFAEINRFYSDSCLWLIELFLSTLSACDLTWIFYWLLVHRFVALAARCWRVRTTRACWTTTGRLARAFDTRCTGCRRPASTCGNASKRASSRTRRYGLLLGVIRLFWWLFWWFSCENSCPKRVFNQMDWFVVVSACFFSPYQTFPFTFQPNSAFYRWLDRLTLCCFDWRKNSMIFAMSTCRFYLNCCWLRRRYSNCWFDGFFVIFGGCLMLEQSMITTFIILDIRLLIEK